MISALEAFVNIPVSTTALASLFPENKAGGEKVRSLEQKEYVIRLKRGLYVVNPEVSRVPLSLELIANRLYTLSYVSMSSAHCPVRVPLKASLSRHPASRKKPKTTPWPPTSR